MHDGGKPIGCVKHLRQRSYALAANELAADFVAEYLTDRPDQVPLGSAAGSASLRWGTAMTAPI